MPGLYFAGTLTQVRDFKKSTNGFIHGFRYGVRALDKILNERHHETPWPSTELPAKPDALTDAMITRINRTSALYQQFGFLGDVLTVDGDTARYLEEVPVDRVLAGPAGTTPSSSPSTTAPTTTRSTRSTSSRAPARTRPTTTVRATTCTRSSGTTAAVSWSRPTTSPRTSRTSGTKRCTSSR